MTVTAQYNSSTAKASYNSSTNKQQVVVASIDPCTLCVSNSPDQVSVTLSGFSVSCCAGTGGDSGKSRIWDTDIESIVNDTHILDHIASCHWQKTIGIDVDILDYAASSGCSGTPTLLNYTSLIVEYFLIEYGSPPDVGCSATVRVYATGDSVTADTLVFARNIDDTNCGVVLGTNCMPKDTLTPASGCDYTDAVKVTGGTIAMAVV